MAQQTHQNKPQTSNIDTPNATEDENTSAVSEKVETINTKAATPAELFEAKLTDLVTKVLRRELQPSQAVRDLHNFWMQLPEVYRERLINIDTPGNIHEAGSRLMQAASMIGNEMPTLVASHSSSKGF
jgi:DNA polymerase sigma